MKWHFLFVGMVLKFLVSLTLFVSAPMVLYSQCTLTTNDDTQAEVLACLSSCGCSEVVIPDGVTIAMDGDWDLTSEGAIMLTIEGSGSLELSGSGANRDDLILASGSVLIIEDTNNTNAIVSTSGGAGQKKIYIGSAEYKTMDFNDIIAAGGADENGYLPVEFVYFNGRRNQIGVQLTWQTASELNNDYFEIETAADGENFLPIARISGAGNSSALINYEWLHRSPIVGLNYYRIKQVDFDGAFSYTDLISVYNDTPIPLFFSAYPQPAADHVTIEVHSSDNDNPLKVLIIGSDGQLARDIGLTPQEREIVLDVNDFRSGVYLVRVVQSGNVYNSKLLISR